MFKKIQAKMKNKKGFTLVELLIVIAVLGIIAAIAVPRFTGVLSGVKDKADFRAAELFAKEIEAEFMLETWAFTDNTIAVAAPADKAAATTGFNGNIPQDSAKGAMKATITRSGTTAPITYSLTITNSAAKDPITLLDAKPIAGPIN